MLRGMSRRKPAARARRIPIQVMVSEQERDDLMLLTAARGLSVSELVRGLIRRSLAASRRVQQSGPPCDPRQAALFES